MTPPTRSIVHPSGGQRSAPAPSDLDDLFQISPQALLMCDPDGQILRANAALQRLVGAPVQQMARLPEGLRVLLGWPEELPAIHQTREREAWVGAAPGRHLRARVRGLVPADGRQRWLMQIEDRSAEDERDVARLEIAALMGDAEVGLASWDAARGWVPPSLTARPAPPREGSAAASSSGAPRAALTSVSKDLVDPASLGEYERLQQALRQRERVEVRYEVRHPEAGQRWLMSRVEPGQLGDGRAAFSVMTLDVSQEEKARRRNEQLLRELSAILDENPAGIAYFRGQALLRCNSRFEALLGQPADSCRGAGLGDLLLRGGLDGPSVQQVLDTLARQDRCEGEFRLAAADGAPARWLSLALRHTGETGQGAEDTVAVLTDVTELRHREAELAALAHERELMFSLSEVGIAYLREGRIERANEAMQQLTGLDGAALRDRPLAELFADDPAGPGLVANERRALAAHGRSSSERPLRRADGGTIWVLFSQRLVDPRQPAAGSICSFVSVDERRRAREQVLQQADRTRAILDSVLVGIVSVDEQGIEWMNRSARRMFGGELADFVGQGIDVVATDDPEHPLRRTDWLDRLEEGQAETFECRITARDGRAFWVVGNVVVTGLDSSQRQLTFALMDIDSRREAEAQIARGRARLQRIIETAPLAIALFDAGSQRVLQLNQMMAAFAQQPADPLMGQPPSRWLAPAAASQLEADLDQAARSHQPVHRELVLGPGTWDVRIVALDASADAPEPQLLLVAADVTEQRAADQARLDAAIAQREMLVKEVHHRIKNNLQGVAGLLQQNAQRHPEAAAAIAEAVGHVHAIAQVHGLQVGISGPLRVRNVAEAICQSVQRMFGRTITVEVVGASPHRFALTEADSIPIALTVNELLTNAIKHGRGELACCLRFGEAEVVIEIASDSRLPPGFTLASVPTGISGLGLVRALLPRKGASMSLEQRGDRVVAGLRLLPPAVTLLGPL